MKRIYFFSVCAVVMTVLCGPVCAQEQRYPVFAEGEYFAVYAYPGVDMYDLLERIQFQSFLFQEDLLAGGQNSVRDLAARTFDALYLEVCEILGLAAYSAKGKIKIFPDQSELNKEFRAIFGRDFHERAFYLHDTRTLYIAHADVHIGMLAHEMAHMAISHYFIVPPSMQVQEILSGYVDYSFRKRLQIPIR